MLVDKSQIFQLLFTQLNDSLDLAIEAAKQAHELATHEQSKPETQYDTVAIEAGFLAQGQAQRVEELKQSLNHWQSLQYKRFSANSEISEGCLVTLTDDEQKQEYYLLGKHAGGLRLDVKDSICFVISESSPMGKLLLGKELGDEISHPTQQQRFLEITAIC